MEVDDTAGQPAETVEDAPPLPGTEDSLFQASDEPVVESVEEPVGDQAPPVADRPEYISESHWDVEKGEVRVESLAKSFKDTKAALDKKRDESGVPSSSDAYFKVHEDGTIFTPDGLDNIPSIPRNDFMLSSVAEAAHKADMTKAQFDAVMGAYLAGSNEIAKQSVFDPEAVMQQIDPDPDRARHTVMGVTAYIKNIPDLTPEETFSVENLMSTAGGVTMMAKLMTINGNLPIPSGAAVSSTPDSDALNARWHELRRDPQALDKSPALKREYELLGRKIKG